MALFRRNGPFFNFYDALPISCFDAFGIGAILALFMIGERNSFSNHIMKIPAWVGFSGAVILSCIVDRLGVSFLFNLTVSLASFYLILKATTGYKGILGLIVNNPVIQYLGKISYGLYVYHNFIPWLVRCITGRESEYPLPLPVIKADWLHGAIPYFTIHFLVLIAVASISWFLVEKPINNLKRYFA